MPRPSNVPAALAVLLLAGCIEPQTGPDLLEPEGASLVITRGPQSPGWAEPNPHFAFLGRPVFALPLTGTFDPAADPVVTVCEYDPLEPVLSHCPKHVVTMTTTRRGAERIRILEDQELYLTYWQTRHFSVSLDKLYRIQVISGHQVLGEIHVDFVATLAEIKRKVIDSERFVGVRRGITLALRFRIEEGAVLAGIYGDWHLGADAFCRDGCEIWNEDDEETHDRKIPGFEEYQVIFDPRLHFGEDGSLEYRASLATSWAEADDRIDVVLWRRDAFLIEGWAEDDIRVIADGEPVGRISGDIFEFAEHLQHQTEIPFGWDVIYVKAGWRLE